MNCKTLYIIALFCSLAASSLLAQETIPKDWNSEKIRGSRFIMYFSCNGNPFLTDKFVIGEIELTDGVKIGNLNLRYSTWQDELIYFNSALSAQIIIDKNSIKGFSFIDASGQKRSFRQQYFNGFLPGYRYFELLSECDISLLAFRKAGLHACAVYTDISGVVKNVEYQNDYTYYLYNPKKGYEQIRIGKNSLLSKFDKHAHKLIKRILRQNMVQIVDEQSFVKAWNLICKNGVSVNF